MSLVSPYRKKGGVGVAGTPKRTKELTEGCEGISVDADETKFWRTLSKSNRSVSRKKKGKENHRIKSVPFAPTAWNGSSNWLERSRKIHKG